MVCCGKESGGSSSGRSSVLVVRVVVKAEIIVSTKKVGMCKRKGTMEESEGGK